jgi:tetratricopeptide (TPR) repeat protein
VGKVWNVSSPAERQSFKSGPERAEGGYNPSRLRIKRRSRISIIYVLILVSCLTISGAAGQGASKPANTKPDYSKEAFVDEDDSTKIVFENDGTGTRETSVRIRIQSDAGVQRYGVLTFPYQSAAENVEIDYVRVQKPEGAVITTPPENIQDMAADITRQAPFYSDHREKQVAVKGLGVGDVLESRARWHVTKPLASGQFWFAFNFSHDFIMLHEEIQISVPRERVVKWKSRDPKPVITEEGSRRIFTWTNFQLEHKSSEQDKKDQQEKIHQAARGMLPPADVQISTFQSWEDVGAWYNGLQQERVKPSAEVRVKAADLTKNASDENAKLHAIYDYVSTQFRYIGVAFGIGRYQPHSAAEVLSNQYGDCKDKHTLLASLLDAAGITAYPALISTARDIDVDVPSPGQFDHVITAVPQGGGFTWLDTTPEVAPFAYLISPLRDKRALVIPVGKPATLVTTAADPPAPGLQTFRIEAKLSDTGTLDGKIERSVSGDDSEVLLRTAFRRVPMPQWKDLIQQISCGSGFAGDVSEVTASSPEKTREPLSWTYNYARKDFPDWSNHRLSSPLPPIALPHEDTQPSYPIWLGSPEELHFESSVELPKGSAPQLPAKLDLREDFAEYHAFYGVKNGVLKSDRRLVVKLREVPVGEYDVYKRFVKMIEDDQNVYIALSEPRRVTPSSYQDAIWMLPFSNNLEATRAYDDARDEYQKRDPEGEIASLKRAVEVDPKFTRAWLWMGEIYKFERKPELALQTYQSAIRNDPQQPLSYKVLAYTLMGMQRFDDAVSAWRQLLAVDPADSDASGSLAYALSALKRYKEAASALESAIKLDPNRADLYVQLGTTYVRAENEEKALAAYKKALEMEPQPVWFNNAGYELADANKQLPLALQYAEKAVREEEQASSKVKLSDLKNEDLGYTHSLAAYWDTLGWVYFRIGNLQQAEKYLNAAWALSLGATEGDHLGKVYEQEHKKEQAVRIYHLALASSRAPDRMKETQARLEHLDAGTKTGGFDGAEELSKLRTFKLPSITPETASAEFFLLLGQGSKVEDVRFVSGSEKLKSAGNVLSSIEFKMPFPDDGPTRLVRRGILSCSSITGCSFVLYTPNLVRSVN